MKKNDVDKLNKVFTKKAGKLLEKMSLRQYINTFGLLQPIRVESKDGKDLYISSNYFANISTRRTLKYLLKEIEYQRKDKWCSQIVVAFIHEVMDLYMTQGDPAIIKAKEKSISKRYNVPISRLKTQVALFINNLDRCKDTYGIYDYFTRIEILMWKYRDVKTLQKDLAQNKVKENDLQILKNLEII